MQEYLTLKLNHGPIVLIPQMILDILNKYRQCRTNQKESGGVFLGNQRGQNLEITEATVPMTGDKSGRCFFHRLSITHQEIADRAWADSGFTVTYLGEWHTHPERVPKPSSQDIKEWKNKLKGYRFPLILVIVGQEKNWIGYIYAGNINTLLWI